MVVLMIFNYIKWIYVKVEKEENTGSHRHYCVPTQQQKSKHVVGRSQATYTPVRFINTSFLNAFSDSRYTTLMVCQ